MTIAVVLAQMSKALASKWVKPRKAYNSHIFRKLNETYAGFLDIDPELLGLE
jgi:hypothetical protein